MKGVFKYIIWLVFWFIVYLMIRNTQNGVVPDIFNLSRLSETTTNDYFKLICEITSSIFAILMAVITMGYELLGKSSRRRKRFNILNKSCVAAYTSMAVVIIVISFYSALSIQSLKQTNNLTTAYFIGILFILFVFLLFIFTIWLLSLSDTLNEVKEMITKTKKNEEYNEDISDELSYYIQEHDREAYRKHILPKLTENSLAMIGQAKDRQLTNFLFQKLTKVWKDGNDEAIREDEEQFFNSIWQNVQSIYEHAAKNKSFLLHYQELENFIRIQIEFLAVKNSVSGLSNGAKAFSAIYLHQLQYNCPKQETISDLYWANEDRDAPNPHPDADLQWDHINYILWEIRQIQDAAIELKSKYLFETVQFEFSSILFGLRYSNNLKLGNYQERSIVYDIVSYQTYYASLALENGMFKNSAEAFHFNVHQIADYIKNEKIFAKDIVKLLEEYILNCQRSKYLDNFKTVRDLGGLGRVIAMEYINNPTVQSAFFAIVEILGKLKTEIENEIHFSQNKNYIETKKQLESLKDHLIKINQSPITGKTISRIDEVLNSF